MQEYRPLNENVRTVDDFLRFMLVKEGLDELKFRQLDENTKGKITNDMINSIIATLKNKTKLLNYVEFEKSKGDVTRIDGFSDLQGSISLLATMHSREGKNAPKEIPQLVACLDNLKKLTPHFRNGFRQGNELVIMLYNNMCMSLVKATSILIATTIEYVRDSFGLYRATFKKNLDKRNEMTLYFNNIKRFNSMVERGQMQTFFDAVTDSSNFSGGLFVGAGLSAIGIILFIIWAIRELIFLYFFVRCKLSVYLKNLSVFIQMNAATLDQKDLGEVRRKQEEIAKKLSDLSEIIAVEEKVGNRKAVTELKKENDKLDLDIDKVSNQGSVFL